jgi:hypothetical protein
MQAVVNIYLRIKKLWLIDWHDDDDDDEDEDEDDDDNNDDALLWISFVLGGSY